MQPGRDPSAVASLAVEAALGGGSALDWRPEPTVICDGAAWEPSVRLDLAEGARARVVEQLVLGRSGQAGGRCATTLRASIAGAPVLALTTLLDGADAALTGIGATGGARSVGSVLVVGTPAPPEEECGDDDGAVWSRSPLAGAGSLLTALGGTLAVARVLAGTGETQRPWW